MISAKKPIHLIQVFSNSYHYDKEYKDYSSRKEVTRWNKKIKSGSLLSDDHKTLTLSKDYYEKKGGFPGNAIILEDYNALSIPNKNARTSNKKIWSSYEEKNVWFCSLSKGIFFWKIFRLSLDKKPLISLQWDEWEVGFPKRLNIKLAKLDVNKPIEIIMDGKRDFSFSGRKERIFIMNNYIFEYKGLIDRIEVNKKSFNIAKELPNSTKKINLMKYVR